MSKYFSTPNQAVAAYMQIKGFKVLDIQKKMMKFDNGDREVYFLEFDVSIEKGKEESKVYYDKVGQVEPSEFYENLKDIRNKLWEYRKKEKEKQDGTQSESREPSKESTDEAVRDSDS